MSISRRPWSWSPDSAGPESGTRTVRLEHRRATREGVVCEATLACPRCDAPVSAGPGGLTLAQDLACPFCGHTGAVRGFLSLSRPTRPARVVVRVRLPGHSGR